MCETKQPGGFTMALLAAEKSSRIFTAEIYRDLCFLAFESIPQAKRVSAFSDSASVAWATAWHAVAVAV